MSESAPLNPDFVFLILKDLAVVLIISVKDVLSVTTSEVLNFHTFVHCVILCSANSSHLFLAKSITLSDDNVPFSINS